MSRRFEGDGQALVAPSTPRSILTARLCRSRFGVCLGSWSTDDTVTKLSQKMDLGGSGFGQDKRH